jgi:predicted nuclease with TOPRIM domain
MQVQLEQRLRELKVEYEAGQKRLAELEAKQTMLRETLWRISGAIQVLEEELARAASPAYDGAAPAAEVGVTRLVPEGA